MFDPKFFQVALDNRPIIASDAKEEAAKVMMKKADACNENMPRNGRTNRHKPIYWWNETIATLHQIRKENY